MKPKGFMVSETSKNKMRETILKQYQNGRIPHNKGMSKNDYTPLKLVSRKMIGNKNPSGRFGRLNGMYGKSNPKVCEANKKRIGEKRSDECRAKMSIKAKQSWIKTREKRIDSFVKIWGKNRKITYLEKKLISLCDRNSLPFKYVGNGKLWITVEGHHMNPDFVDTKGLKIFIEVYAKFFKPDNYELERGRLLSIAGFKTIFLSNVIMDSEDWEQNCLDKIIPFI